MSRDPIDPAKMILLFNASKALAAATDLDHLLSVVVSEVQGVLDCEGAGVALFDEERAEFYWRTVQDKESYLSSAKEEIRIPRDRGVCGWVFDTGKPALVQDALNDPRVYREVDTISGFTTKSMICVPLQTRDKRQGVLYALNKVDGTFNEEDVEIMSALAGSVALALENAAYYESLANSHKDLERLNVVKNKMLNHLSHELKTPLAIIEASLRIIERRLEAKGLEFPRQPYQRIVRSLGRLKNIEKQVSHIVEEKEYPERRVILGFFDQLGDLIEIEKEEEPCLAEAMDALRARIEKQFPSRIEETERVSVAAAFQAAEFRVSRMMGDRVLDVQFLKPDPAVIKMQHQIMSAVIGGLVRNAIENTPDHGKIVVTGENSSSGYRITVRDYGVGIPEEQQRDLFECFCPVQDTDLYSSGRRYEFNAGGTGTDLMKIKIFSERSGFGLGFQSTRCSCIPTAGDLCPGDIAACRCCERIEDCLENGGSQFVIEIPPDHVESVTAESHVVMQV